MLIGKNTALDFKSITFYCLECDNKSQIGFCVDDPTTVENETRWCRNCAKKSMVSEQVYNNIRNIKVNFNIKGTAGTFVGYFEEYNPKTGEVIIHFGGKYKGKSVQSSKSDLTLLSYQIGNQIKEVGKREGKQNDAWKALRKAKSRLGKNPVNIIKATTVIKEAPKISKPTFSFYEVL
jgi:hypothetical protein